jgi:CheY-specific phosphatase CheX
MSPPAFRAWLGQLEAAFGDVVGAALGLGRVEVTARGEAAPASWQGAYLGLVGPAGGVQIGVASDADGCQALAKGLLGMESGGEELPVAEMADALCEVVNIVAGAFKGRVRESGAPLQMGLPIFFHGAVQETEHTALSVAEVRAGGVPAALVLVHPRGPAEA